MEGFDRFYAILVLIIVSPVLLAMAYGTLTFMLSKAAEALRALFRA